MNLYIIGRCPNCNNIVAAAIDIDPNGDAEGIREAINEFLDCGHMVSAIRTDERVSIEGHTKNCRFGEMVAGDDMSGPRLTCAACSKVTDVPGFCDECSQEQIEETFKRR